MNDKERAVSIKKDSQGNIIEIQTNKGNAYDYEIAQELIEKNKMTIKES